ncbi:MAG TPA: hypothetical protein DCM62_09765 [Bacteroidales bacterium]|nr:hypothetical protein [Bacteroidales bacterium]
MEKFRINRILFLSVIIFSSFLYACTSFVEEIDLPFKEPPIVVHSYLYPGMEEIQVSVLYAANVGGGRNADEQQPVRNAMVRIWSRIHSPLVLPFDDATGLFSASSTHLPVVSGVEYFLKIELPGRLPIEGRVMVPFGNKRFYANLVLSETRGDMHNLRFDAHIEDKLGEKNFYKFFAFVEGERVCVDGASITTTPFSDLIFNFTSLESDENRDGQIIFFPGRQLYYSTRQSPGNCPHRVDHLRMRLFFLEEQTYRYLESVYAFDAAIGNPFVVPQSPVTNLTNAVGVFGAYALVEKIILAEDFGL